MICLFTPIAGSDLNNNKVYFKELDHVLYFANASVFSIVLPLAPLMDLCSESQHQIFLLQNLVNEHAFIDDDRHSLLNTITSGSFLLHNDCYKLRNIQQLAQPRRPKRDLENLVRSWGDDLGIQLDNMAHNPDAAFRLEDTRIRHTQQALLHLRTATNAINNATSAVRIYPNLFQWLSALSVLSHLLTDIFSLIRSDTHVDLPLQLLNSSSVAHIIQLHRQHVLHQHGIQLVHSPQGLRQLPIKWHLSNRYDLMIYFMIPIPHTSYRHLQYHPFPILHAAETHTHALIWSPQKKHLLIPSLRPHSYLETDLSSLQHMCFLHHEHDRTHRLCQRRGVLFQEREGCLKALYDNDFHEASAQCERHWYQGRQNLIPLENNWFRTYNAQPTGGIISCMNGSVSKDTYGNIQDVHIPNSCTFRCKDIWVTTGQHDTEKWIQTEMSPDSIDLMAYNRNPKVLDTIKEELHKAGNFEPDLPIGVHLQRHQSWLSKLKDGFVSDMKTIGLAIIAVIVILFSLWCCGSCCINCVKGFCTKFKKDLTANNEPALTHDK